jgi:hypothetical protein
MNKIFTISRSIFILILTVSFSSASDILVWQGQYYTGTTFHTGTYAFNFTIYDNLTEGSICYSNATNLTTGNFGEWSTEQKGVNSACNNVSKDYYLNINIQGVDQIPRRRLLAWNYLRKNVDEITTGKLQTVSQILAPIINATQIVSPIVNATQIQVTNLTTLNYGFFNYLGDEVNRITSLVIQNIESQSIHVNEKIITPELNITNNLTINSKIKIGTQDAFGRNQIWNTMTNSILRLGALGPDGDAFSQSSEGIVVYGKNIQGDVMTGQNFSYARVKPKRFGLYHSMDGGYVGYLFLIDLITNEFYVKNISGNKMLNLNMTNGDLSIAGNLTMNSPNGISWNCGVDNIGTFSCS